jgi:hypothetical protein
MWMEGICPSLITVAEVSAALPFVIPSINRKVLSRANECEELR